ncbi:prenyltransferase/squalene oxidase repeat-containing protein, partial [Candidatus Riflebacteria bacterium]
MFNSEDCRTIKKAFFLLEKKLLQAQLPDGTWQGYLASSAVSTAVAALALSLSRKDSDRVALAINWLTENMNSDGGWGDTPGSPSNLSAVLLARAALTYAGLEKNIVKQALHRSRNWLQTKISGESASELINSVLKFYGRDRTFSVPIITVCLLSGSFGKDRNTWRGVPRLPFEAAVLPDKIYHLLQLPVVSYALPALIAVGIAQFKHCPAEFPLIKFIRKMALRPALKKLRSLLPGNGGFLEAAPLTGFVAFCLGRSGYKKHFVVR